MVVDMVLEREGCRGGYGFGEENLVVVDMGFERG